MWLFRVFLFGAGTFVGAEVLLLACLECEVCVRTFHPTMFGWGVALAIAVGIVYRLEMCTGSIVLETSPAVDSAALATGVWSPFALQALLAALL